MPTNGTVAVGRFGADPVQVKCKSGSTVGAVLETAGITLGETEKVWLNGSKAKAGDKTKSGDIVSIVTPKAGGR